MEADQQITNLLTKIEQTVKSEVKVLLARQRSMENHQVKFEMLLKQWIDAGNHRGPHTESNQNHTGEKLESSPTICAPLMQQSSELSDVVGSGAQAANPGQDQLDLRGRSESPQPSVQSSFEGELPETPNSRGNRQSSCPSMNDAKSVKSARSWAPRESELGRQLQRKTLSARSLDHHKILDRIVFSWKFDVVFGLLIVLNSISIGVEIEYKTTHASPHKSFTFTAAAFAVLFLLELVLRIAANEIMIYFMGPDKAWNVFDVAMVIVSLIEVFDTLLSAGGRSTPALRMVRMLRLLRIARVLRFVPQLRIILLMVFESIKSLGWLLCILVTILYVFSIVFTMGAIDYLGVPGDPDFGSKRNSAEIETHFGTLMRSVYSLFKAITSGQSWGEMMDPLTDVSAFFVMVFLCYVAFAVLALLNVIAGVFVERAMTKSQCDRELLVEKQMQAKQACVKHLKVMFEEGDHDGSGQITLVEFQENMKDERFIAYLSHLGIDTDGPRDGPLDNISALFDQLDRDKSGSISIEEFVDNLLHLTRGQTAEQVVQRLVNENRNVKHLIFKLMDFVEVEITNIKLRISAAVANDFVV